MIGHKPQFTDMCVYIYTHILKFSYCQSPTDSPNQVGVQPDRQVDSLDPWIGLTLHKGASWYSIIVRTFLVF